MISISQEENLGLKIFLFFRNQVTQTNLKKEYSIAEPFAGLIGAKKLEEKISQLMFIWAYQSL